MRSGEGVGHLRWRNVLEVHNRDETSDTPVYLSPVVGENGRRNVDRWGRTGVTVTG